MADELQTKAPFWSSLPGILTGISGILLALTGLITALYSNGVFGTKANSNTSSPNTAVSLSAAPSPSPSATPNPVNDHYKSLAGKWRVVEEPSLDPYFVKVKRITWEYDALVKGDGLTLTGKILFLNNLNDKPVNGEELINAKYEATLAGLIGDGKYTHTNFDGSSQANDATIRFDKDLKKFRVIIEGGKRTVTLTGSKQEN